MDTEPQHAEHQVTHVVEELPVQQDVLHWLGEGAAVPHHADYVYHAVHNLTQTSQTGNHGYNTSLVLP